VDGAPVDSAARGAADVRVDERVGWTPLRPPGPPGPAPGTGRHHGAGAPDLPARRDPSDPPLQPWDPSVAAALAQAAGPATRVAAPRVRWAPGWRAAGSAVIVLALVAGGILLRTSTAPRGEPVVVPTPAVPGAAADAAQGGAAGGDAEDHVVVHVVGAVAQPGVVRLGLGARVADALAAVGGGLPEADLAGVNLARLLTDGEQLVVPVLGEPATGAAAGVAHDGLVDLNTADAAALEALPGVGPVLAARIVEHRADHPFTAVDDLDDVAGIGPALLADLRERVRV